ncbi:MAG TPA: L-threonylcarbamoyladenylate synthase [Rhizomicrobium sp.]|nr:L-threonylcarbamoyladenylate synthase [Rhizomicrobium sp.]
MIAGTIRTADTAAIHDAAKLLRGGGLVAFPTETVYGLGADATNDRAVAAIFAAKERPRFNPLIVHVADVDEAKQLVAFTPAARRLAERFWPGALTLVLPRKADARLSLLVSAGLDTVAVRVPDEAIAQQLLAAAEIPIAAPSANASGEVSPTTAEHVRQSLGEKVDLILDGGPTRLGLESTVVGFDDGKPVLLRPGSIPRVKIESVAGPLGHPADDAISSPGQLASHYAPDARVRLNAMSAAPGELLLAFGPATGAALNLSPKGDLEEAAANLFAMLRKLDALEPHAIAVMPIPDHGLGEAINDRLRRAAAPRGLRT